MKRLIFIPLLILWAQAAVAASPTVVDGDYVAAAIARNAVVWDVRPAAAYAKGHIAGAISIGDVAKVLRDENTEDFIATDRIEKILGAAGLDPHRETIVYGSRGTWNPYFGLYTLQYFGGSNVRVYHAHRQLGELQTIRAGIVAGLTEWKNRKNSGMVCPLFLVRNHSAS